MLIEDGIWRIEYEAVRRDDGMWRQESRGRVVFGAAALIKSKLTAKSSGGEVKPGWVMGEVQYV